MNSVPRPIMARFVLGVLVLMVSYACSSSSGCSGCNTTTIPGGGFPAAKKFDNAMQVRLSQGGINFMENNLGSLIGKLVPGGLNFDIPPTGCTSGSQKVCCSGAKCKASVSIDNVKMTPTPTSSLKTEMRAKVTTTKMYVQMKLVWPLGWVGCDMAYNSASSSPSTIGLNTSVDFVVQPASKIMPNELEIKMTGTTLKDFQVKDAKLSGKWYCTAGEFLKNLPLISGLVKNEIEKQLKKTLSDTMTSMLKTLPLGQQGRVDIASFMSSISPTTTGKMDFMMWAGGHAKAENAGMSIGVMGGFQPAAYNACVVKRPAPKKVAIPWSKTFTGNMRPDGKPFHVGIGVHRLALDAASWALYSSGVLCLDVDSSTVPQISSSMFSLLLPSINDLTGGTNVPMLLAIRPRYAPTVALGLGTYTLGSDKKPVIKEPLMIINAKDFAIDLYVLVEQRMVRLFTIVTDLQVPMLLYATNKGQLQPMLGNLKTALKNIRLENYELISEDPKKVTSLLPTLIALASGSLASSFQPIDIPSVQGLNLILDSGSITSVDKNAAGSYNTLAIFSKLGLAKTTPGPSPVPSPSVDTEVTVEQVEVPPTAAFRVNSPGHDPWSGPKVVINARARVPAALAGQPLEFAYSVDNSFYRTWSGSDRLVIQDPLLWLQGEHTVDVMARVVGQPYTTDPTPARVTVQIDTMPPRVNLVRSAGQVRADIQDLVSSTADLQLSWSIGDGAFGPYGTQRSVVVPEGTRVAVKVRDRAGNVAWTNTTITADTMAPDAPSAGGCTVGGRASTGLALLALMALVGVVALRRRRE